MKYESREECNAHKHKYIVNTWTIMIILSIIMVAVPMTTSMYQTAIINYRYKDLNPAIMVCSGLGKRHLIGV